MKILVFSDTHNASRRMLEVAMQHRDAEAAIHLGDGLRDAEALVALFGPSSLFCVRGNCDYEHSDNEERLVRLGGSLFFMCHGNTYGVKYGLDELYRTAKGLGAKAALFGHTHRPLYEKRGAVHLFNPGSLTMPRDGEPTYGMIEVSRGKEPKFEILHYWP